MAEREDYVSLRSPFSRVGRASIKTMASRCAVLPFSFLWLAKASFRRPEMEMAPFGAMVLFGGERGI